MNPADPHALGDRPAADSTERLELMRRVAIAMFLVGGCTAALGVEITARTSQARWTQGACAAAFVACGLVLLSAPARRRLAEVSLFVAIGVLGALIAGSDPTGMAPIFYLWPMVYAAYFSSQRLAAACMSWSALTLAVGLALNRHHDLKVDTFIGTISSVGLMTVLISMMTRRENRLRDDLASIARTDSLTGLLSRRAFDHELSTMIQRAADRDATLTVVMFNLDHFKQFNDRHGHLAGDDALRTVASVLRANARPGDALGRFGGEEFTVVLADADVRSAQSYVERVARQLSDVDDVRVQHLTTSAGISTLADGPSPSDLIARADEALYAAKAAGRARAAWFDDGLIRTGACFHCA